MGLSHGKENIYEKYGQPTLDLVFTGPKKSLTDRVGNVAVGFARTTTATYVGSDGLIKTAAVDEARFDHDPTTGENLGLLVEESRTNVLYPSTPDYSGGFGSWSNGSAPLTANAGTAPDGTNTAVLTAWDTVSGAERMYYDTGTPSSVGVTEVHSFFVKAKTPGSGDVFAVTFQGTNWGSSGTYFFDFDTETLTGGAVDKTVIKYPDGWYRVSFSMTNSGTGVFDTYVQIRRNQQTGNWYIWGCQREDGSFPTSYIPTTSSTVTRGADTASISNAINTTAFTIINEPFGSASGSDTFQILGAGSSPVKRTTVYGRNLNQSEINSFAEITDDFWRWRVLGSSFALPSFTTDGQVTVDWGDGTVETLTTIEHTFSNGGSYHEIGFRLDSGTYFKPNVANDATHKDKVVAVGPAPESMVIDGYTVFHGCSNFEVFDATADFTGGTNLYRSWSGCTSLTSFPFIDCPQVTSAQEAWYNCDNLTTFSAIDFPVCTSFYQAWASQDNLPSFPAIDLGSQAASTVNLYRAWYQNTSLTDWGACDTSNVNNMQGAWYKTALTSFPVIDCSSVTTAQDAWFDCNSLTTFPAIDFPVCSTFYQAWQDCDNLTTFPAIDLGSQAATVNLYRAWKGCNSMTTFGACDTSKVTNAQEAWYGCNSLTPFPTIDLSNATTIQEAWQSCTSLTSFPSINMPLLTTAYQAWNGCSGLTSFPAIDLGSTGGGCSFYRAWKGCSSMTTFGACNLSAGTNFEEAWNGCSGLTSFPALTLSNATGIQSTWLGCTSLTSFPVINMPLLTTAYQAWNGCSGLTSFPAVDLGSTGGGCNFYRAWKSCSSMTTFGACNLDAGTTFNETWQNCTNLTTFPANMFDAATATNYTNAFSGCALTAASVENILVSIDTSGVSNGTLTINGGTTAGYSTWSSAAQTALSNLQGKGWTVSYNS